MQHIRLLCLLLYAISMSTSQIVNADWMAVATASG